MNRKLAAQRVARRYKVASFNSQAASALRKHKKEASIIKSAIREVGMSNVVRQAKNRKVAKTKDMILKKISSKPLKAQFNDLVEIFENREEIATQLLEESSLDKKAGLLTTLGAPLWLIKGLAWLTASTFGTVVLVIAVACIIGMGYILGLLFMESLPYMFLGFLKFVFITFPLFIFKAVMAPVKFLADLASKFDEKVREEEKVLDFEELENPSDREEVEQFRRAR